VYRQFGHGPGGFPGAELAQEAVLSLPMYPEMTVLATDEIVDSIRAVVPASI